MEDTIDDGEKCIRLSSNLSIDKMGTSLGEDIRKDDGTMPRADEWEVEGGITFIIFPEG